MPQINLLPWREELRSRRQKEFGVTALIAVVLMCVVIAGVHYQGTVRGRWQAVGPFGPLLSAIGADVHTELGAKEQQVRLDGILFDHVHETVDVRGHQAGP